MRIAVIDCGTNTFNLLIKDWENGEVVFNDKISVRLAEGGITENQISDAAFERGQAAIGSHLETIKSLGANATYVMATSAIRSATNGPDFVKQAKARHQVNINVISGAEEAELIYAGVKKGIRFEEAPTLIMDIGGGSTEFIVLRNQKAVYKGSFLIGSSRLLEKFRPADPILPEEIDGINNHLEEELTDLIAACKPELPRVLIGSSGSFDTLAQMCVENFGTSRLEPEHSSYTFSMFEYMQIAERMVKSNFHERLNTPGMIPMRADNIVMACLQINFIIKRCGIKLLQQCSYALKEGLFFTLKENNNRWQKS